MEVELAPGEAVLVDWTAERYFSDRTALTRSALWLLADDPELFEKRWELGEHVGSDSTPSTDFGTSGHLAILEPAEWERRVGLPKPPRPSKGRPAKLIDLALRTGMQESDLLKMLPANNKALAVMQQARELVQRLIPDRIDIDLADYLRLLCVRKSVWSHPQAAALIGSPGPIHPVTGEPTSGVEQTILWREPTSGLLVKVRIDKLSDIDPDVADDVGLPPGIVIGDLKTTRARGRRAGYMLSKSAREFGYHVQDAMYRDAAEAAFGQPIEFYFVGVGNTGNFETSVWRLPDHAVEQGREFYQEKLLEIIDRRAMYDWRHAYSRGVNTLPWSTR